MTERQRAALIAMQNDLFRTSRNQLLGRFCFTEGVKGMGDLAVIEAVSIVSRFKAFTPDNDPHGERDFGVFDLRGERLFWKIDYFSDERMVFGSRDPSDPNQTYRLLTIMLASEY